MLFLLYFVNIYVSELVNYWYYGIFPMANDDYFVSGTVYNFVVPLVLVAFPGVFLVLVFFLKLPTQESPTRCFPPCRSCTPFWCPSMSSGVPSCLCWPRWDEARNWPRISKHSERHGTAWQQRCSHLLFFWNKKRLNLTQPNFYLCKNCSSFSFVLCS